MTQVDTHKTAVMIGSEVNVKFTLDEGTEEALKQLIENSTIRHAPTPFWLISSARMWLAVALGVMVGAIAAARTSLATALICMLNNTRTAVDASRNSSMLTDGACAISNEGEEALYEGSIEWSSDQVAMLFSVVFWGCIVTGMPGGYLADRFGAKLFMVACVVITTLCTGAFPLAAEHVGFAAAFACRLIFGLGYGIMLPCILSMTSKWYARHERTTVLTMWSTGNQMGTMASYPIGSAFCGMHNGWPYIFYTIAAMGIVSIILLVLLTANSPDRHLWISKEERDYINQQNGDEQFGSRRLASSVVPWCSIATSPAVLVTLLSTYTSTMVLMTMSFYLPSYLHTVLGMDMKQNAVLSMLPWLAMWVGKVAATITSNVVVRKGIVTQSTVSRVAQTMFLCATLLMLATTLPCERRVMAVVCITLSCMSLGLIIPGHMTALTCIAPAYTGLLSSIARVGMGLGGSIGPMIIGRFVIHGTREEYQWGFGIIAIQMVGSGVLFAIFGTTRVQDWAVPPKASSAATMKYAARLAELREEHFKKNGGAKI